jgi:hypothetical protein
MHHRELKTADKLHAMAPAEELLKASQEDQPIHLFFEQNLSHNPEPAMSI